MPCQYPSDKASHLFSRRACLVSDRHTRGDHHGTVDRYRARRARHNQRAEDASRRGDATLTPPVTIWAVRHDDDVYVRSVNGPSATWYRAAKRRGVGRIWSGGSSGTSGSSSQRGTSRTRSTAPTATSTERHPARPDASSRRSPAPRRSGSRPPTATERTAEPFTSFQRRSAALASELGDQAIAIEADGHRPRLVASPRAELRYRVPTVAGI